MSLPTSKNCASKDHVGPNPLPITQFYKRARSNDGLHTWCKECCKRYSRMKSPKRRKQEIHRESHRRIKYDITPDQYAHLYALQEGRCAICGDDSELFVDHDHETGNARGLLCRKCNTGLGYFNDDPLYLSNAINYIQEPPYGRLPKDD